jgi:hypothetical protein
MRTIARRLTVVVAAGAIMLMTAGIASASSETTTSTAREVLDLGNGWFSNSPVTTDVTKDVTQTPRTRTVPGDFTAQVQQPINPNGTSTWPAKRGVLPVQFKLTKSDKVEQTLDTVTDTTTVKTPRFESVCGPDDTAYSVIGKYAQIPTGTTVKDITKVQAGFNFMAGASAKGSLRWDIGTEFGDLHVYYGDGPNWTGDGGTDVNLMDATDNRFDDGNTSVPGGTFYNTKAQILDKVGDAKVNNVSLVVDSCWAGTDQKLDIDYATVGIKGEDSTIANPLAPKTTTSHVVTPGTVWTLIGTSNPVQTNDVPAKLVVKKFNDGNNTEVVNEVLSSAQGDATGMFRQIDGKYMYNLKIESLTGPGDYRVYMNINGQDVLTSPGEFSLR